MLRRRDGSKMNRSRHLVDFQVSGSLSLDRGQGKRAPCPRSGRRDRHRLRLVTTNVTDAVTYYRIATPALNIRVSKSPLRFSVYRAGNSTLVWAESQPLSWTGTQASRYLTQGADEQFYGTGLRLGEWALRGKTVPVSGTGDVRVRAPARAPAPTPASRPRAATSSPSTRPPPPAASPSTARPCRR
ncbi:hypothetical protein ACH4A8_40320 [Streptomyces vietnamensis]|uniref:hypothetical protein n=1 Tax=Streptomyces vietnamensis TaxID=362257 RepID=UPI00378A6367